MKTLIKSLASLGLLIFGTQAQALIITPSDCSAMGGTISCQAGIAANSNNQSDIDTWLAANYPTISELYKQDVGAGSDSGSLAGSYETTFLNSSTDPADADIDYISGDSVACPTCFLLVKDGRQEPANYWFDLSSVWNGTDTIELRNFWPNQGAISHVSLYSDGTPVPEPSMIGLLAIGLIGAAVARRKIR
jgi:hypothetical protein